MKEKISYIRAVSILVCRGIGQENEQDTINSLYIAKKLGKVKIPFAYYNFRSFGATGVDSTQISRLLSLEEDRIVDDVNRIRLENLNLEEKKLYRMAEYLSNLSSQKIGITAQYLFDKSIGNNGRTHLHPIEAELARNLKEVIKMDALEEKKK
jgi:hypothetical protein